MYELLGMSANFTGLIQRGGKTGPHADGWGINFYEGHCDCHPTTHHQ